MYEEIRRRKKRKFNNIGIIVLMIIVVGTQFLSQWLSERRQKKNKEESQADIPAYRRQAYEQQKNRLYWC